MLIDLRQAIINRVKDKEKDELFSVVNESIGGDDKALPGLGVLFEMIWEHIPEKTQGELIDALKEHLNSLGVSQ